MSKRIEFKVGEWVKQGSRSAYLDKDGFFALASSEAICGYSLGDHTRHFTKSETLARAWLDAKSDREKSAISRKLVNQ